MSDDQVPEGASPIASTTYRQRARVAGRVRSVRVQPWSGVATLECQVVDPTGGILVVFLGRKQVAGIAPPVLMVPDMEGYLKEHALKLAPSRLR